MNIKKGQEVLNKLKEYNTIIIHRHVNPDPDALGSQGGLQKVLQTSFPEKKVYVVGEEVEGLKFLNRMDEIEDEVYNGALVIVCDTANEERISDKRFIKGEFIIKIDHHPNREPYGDLLWVDTSYSSTSEMLVDFFVEFNQVLQVTKDAAKLLYAGIIGDTGRFLYDNTTSRTLRLAGELLESSFNPTEIYQELYTTSIETAKLQGFILQQFQVTKNGLASIFITKKIMEEFNVSPIEAANLVNSMANIEGNQIWVLFIEYDEEIRVRIRSKKTEIHTTAYLFNGGGHPLASGASVKDMNEGAQLLRTLDDLLEF